MDRHRRAHRICPAGEAVDPHLSPPAPLHHLRPEARRAPRALALKDPAFAEKAARLPVADEMPAGYVSTHVLLQTTTAGMTVPRMGLHWLDIKSPELSPANRPFTATFIVA